MKDQQIIDAARDAGLCFPTCWYLDYSDQQAAQDADWIACAPTDEERQTRQAIFDADQHLRSKRMASLRAFAANILALSAQS